MYEKAFVFLYFKLIGISSLQDCCDFLMLCRWRHVTITVIMSFGLVKLVHVFLNLLIII